MSTNLPDCDALHDYRQSLPVALKQQRLRSASCAKPAAAPIVKKNGAKKRFL
jgi:hypothetical protein